MKKINKYDRAHNITLKHMYNVYSLKYGAVIILLLIKH